MTDVQPKIVHAKSTWIGALEFDDPELWDAFLTYGQPTTGVDASGEDTQTSSGTPSSQPAVVANGAPEDGLTAAFKAVEHPRGKDGKFIKKGVGLPGILVDTLKLLRAAKSDASELTEGEKVDSVTDISHITPKQWDNLKDEDKAHITKLAEDALDEGVPGSAAALTHLDDLDASDGEADVPNVFHPATELPKSAPAPAPAPAAPTTTVVKATPIKVTHGLIHAKHTPGEVIAMHAGVKVKWNGDSYDVVGGNGQVVFPKVKKSKLYALLAEKYPNKQWFAPGKQDLEINAPSINAPSAPDITPPTLNAPATKLGFPSGTQTATADVAWHNTDEYGTPSFHESGKYKIELKYGSVRLFKKKKSNGEWDSGEQVDEGQIPLGTWGDAEPIGVPVVVSVTPTKAVPHPIKDVSSASPGESTSFTIIKDKGKSGDGFVAPGIWGKYGAAGVMIRAKGDDGEYRYLLVQRGAGYDSPLKWQLPGGAIDELETPEQGAAREIFEEIGAPESYLKTMVHKGTHAVNVDIGKDKPWTYSNIAADAPTQFKPKIDGTETADAKWLTKDEIQQMLKNGELHSPFANQLDKVFGLWGGSQDNETTIDVPNTPDLVPEPLGVPTPSPKPILTNEDWLKQWSKGLLTNAEYKLLTGEDPPVDSASPSHTGPSPSPDYTSVNALFHGVKTDLYAGKYSLGDVIATGKSDKHPNAEYRLIVDTQGQPVFEYKTPNFDWKENITPQTFDKVNVEWIVNPPSGESGKSNVDWHDVVFNATNGELLAHAPGGFQAIYDGPNDTVQVFENGAYLQTLSADDVENGALEGAFPSLNWSTGAVPSTPNPVTAPTTPAAGVSTVPHLSEDIISYWPGVGGASYAPDQVVAHSIDGKFTLKKSDTPGSDFFTVYDSVGDALASYSTNEVKKGELAKDFPGVADWVIPSKATNAPASLNAPSPTGSAPSVGIGHLIFAKKWNFYTHFKNEKVSPAWSGAKIYNSLQVAKTKMAGDPEIAALSDEQMLDLVDDQLVNVASPGGKYMPGDAPYKQKVIDWLKTPNGKKAALAAKSGGWASGHASVPAKKAVKSATKATSDTSSPPIGSGIHITPDLMSGVTPAQLSAFYKKFKGKNFGTSISGSPVDQVYANALTIAQDSHTLNGDLHIGKELTAGDVLRLMDEETKKLNPGSESTYAIYESKVADWLKTPSGAKKSIEIQKNVAAGTYKPTVAKKASYSSHTSTYGSSYGGSYTHPASKPYSEKVQLKGGGIEPYDSSKGPKDFPTVSTAHGAKLWSDMEAAGGGPITTGQKASLKYYTSNAGYTAMNLYLRGKSGATDTTQNHINKAQDGMRPLTQDVTLYRGAGWFTGWGSYAEIKAREGTVWHEPAFFSASVGAKSGFGGSIGYIIEAPKGTPGAFVKAFSHYGSENELFLAAGLKYQVISVENKGTPTTSGSQVTVRLRVVPDSTPSLNVVASGKKA